jgi:hypothetical protein
MTPGAAAATAVCFTWLGMVLAISFLEAPLKFRTPGLELPLGLAIGRIVFRALNAVELVLLTALLVAVGVGRPSGAIVALAGAAGAILLSQLLAVRPRLTRRSNRVLAGEEAPRSHAHVAYIALEFTKVIALIVLGGLLLSH